MDIISLIIIIITITIQLFVMRNVRVVACSLAYWKLSVKRSMGLQVTVIIKADHKPVDVELHEIAKINIIQ